MSKRTISSSKSQTTEDALHIIDLNDAIRGLSWCPQGKRLLVWTQGGMLCLFESNGKLLRRYDAHRSAVIRACWSSDGALIASSSTDGTCRIWESQSLLCLSEIDNPEGWVEHLVWSPWCRLLLTGASNKLRIWNESGQLVDELSGHQWPITDACWHPTERDIFASCGADGVRAWKLGEREASHSLDGRNYPKQLCFNRRGRVLAIGCSDSALGVWTMNNGIVLKLNARDGDFEAMDWSWGGQWLAFCGGYGAYIWKLNHLFPRATTPTPLTGNFGLFTALKFHPYEPLLACGDNEGWINVWSTSSGMPTSPVATAFAKSAVSCVCWNPLYRQLAIGFRSGELRLWSSTFR